MRRIRGAQIAMILQDPMASLNPLFSIYTPGRRAGLLPSRAARPIAARARARTVERGAHPLADAAHARISAPDERAGCGSASSARSRLPAGPELIIADEPTTNLDVTIQAQYLDLLKELQEKTGVAIIFVTHNLGIVARMCDKLAVMYAGKIVEAGSVRDLFNTPKHPYTKALLGSMPKLGSKEKLLAIPGQPPDLATLPTGCAFHPRCPEALPICACEEPGEVRVDGSRTARCWRAEPQINDPAKEIHAAAAGN